MTVEEDVKPKDDADRPETRAEDASRPEERSESAGGPNPSHPGGEDARDALARQSDAEVHAVAPAGAFSPTQLGGTEKFVYAAYFVGAVGIAFVVSKALEFGWLRLQSYKPAVGEPRDEIVMPLAALVGAGAALYYWYRTRARELAEEVATEMSKVTWPSRTEVTNGTVVVIVTTVVSTVFFALMDKFWGFVTNLVYGGS
jgi:preprotein translocase subunit SecE